MYDIYILHIFQKVKFSEKKWMSFSSNIADMLPFEYEIIFGKFEPMLKYQWLN